jgi:hypothetical protein
MNGKEKKDCSGTNANLDILTILMSFRKCHCMCKEMTVIPVNKAVDPKRIVGKNGGPRMRRGIRGSLTQKDVI